MLPWLGPVSALQGSAGSPFLAQKGIPDKEGRPLKVSLVSVPNVDAVWPHVADGIDQAVKRCDSDLTVAFLWQLCRSGTGFLVIASDDESRIVAATIHRFEPYRSGMKLCCLAAWGPGMKWWLKDMKAVATIIAKAGGANAFITEGSDAYLRMLPGSKKVRTLIEVPFDG